MKKLFIRWKRTINFFLVGLLLALFLPHMGSAEEETDAAALYQRRCSTCHGTDGVPRGFAKSSPHFNDPEWKKSVTVEELVKTITQGKGRMPSFKGRLTDKEIEAVAEFVKNL